MCKLFLRNPLCVQICNPTKQVARGPAALWGCSAGDTRAVLMALGIHSSAISYKSVFILYPKETEGSCLKLVKGTEKNVKCNKVQLLHPGWCFFSLTPPKNSTGLLSAPQKAK